MQISERHWIQSFWRDAKRWRHLPLGPVRMTYKFGRKRKGRTYGGSLSQARIDAASRAQTAAQHDTGVAVIVGAGPGLGEAVATRLARQGVTVAIVSRSKQAVQQEARDLAAVTGATVRGFAADATDEREVIRLIADIENELGPVGMLVYAVQNSTPGCVLTAEVSAFEECWRGNCLGAFVVAREAARRMVGRGSGTILLCGATSGTVGRKGYVNLAIGKFGLRALSQVMARELGPKGVHVVHVLIDADIAETDEEDGEPHARPEELAELFWQLHSQPRSCWTSELDVRPSNEAFWEHC